jgi:hypothetical protein
MIDQHPFFLETLAQVDNNISFLTTPQGGMWTSTTPNPFVSSSIWTIHWATNGSTSKFHLEASTPSYPFQHVFQWNI